MTYSYKTSTHQLRFNTIQSHLKVRGKIK